MRALTERTNHFDSIRRSLQVHDLEPLVLHGCMSKKQRAKRAAQIDELPPDLPQILLGTGCHIEDPNFFTLDTSVQAMPVSWKGTLQQYAGLLYREHATMTDVESSISWLPRIPHYSR